MESKIIQNNNMTYCQLSDDWMSVTILTWGARLISVEMPDKKGHRDNIVLSYDNLEDFKNDTYCFGATVGPVAGRIAGGQWEHYQLEQNEGKHTLHSGSNGWQSRPFDIVSHYSNDYYAEVTFRPQMMNIGMPESVTEVTYRLTKDHELFIIYTTTAQEKMIWNPTNHTYFNLSGKTQSIRDHQLFIDSQYRLELDKERIPTGQKLPVKNTPYDFTSLNSLHQLPKCGLDDCFILEKEFQNKGALVLQHLESGRKIKINTMRDSVILFTGTGMMDSHISIHGNPLISEEGIAIECQECPDAIHHQQSNIIVDKDETRTKVTSYHFSLI